VDEIFTVSCAVSDRKSRYPPLQVGGVVAVHVSLWKSTFIGKMLSQAEFSDLETEGSLFATIFHGLVDPLFGSSWQEWHRYKLHRGIELDPWVKEWPPSRVYDLTHGRRRGLF